MRRHSLSGVWVLAVVLLLQGCTASQTDSMGAGSEKAGVTRGTVAGSWYPYDSIQELTEGADLVVTGTVGKRVDRYEIYDLDEATGNRILAKADNVFEFRVAEVLSGNAVPGQTILIGSADFGAPMENVTEFIPNEELLLFLATYRFGGEVDGWVPLSSDTGVFEVSNGQATARGVVGELAGLTQSVAGIRATILETSGR
jgi:hypothetical protein